jgi:hypothetical protein
VHASVQQLASAVLEHTGSRCDADPSTKVYRIADFFSVAEAIQKQRLKLTRISTYSDKNEGVDNLVRGLIVSALAGDWRMRGGHDEESAATFVDNERQCRFVSCWSRNPESHAMWAMYSQDQCSVRVQTTVGKLQQLCALAWAEALHSFYCGERGDETDGPPPLLAEADVLPVRYADLQSLLLRLSRRTRLARRLVKDTAARLKKPGKIAKWERKWATYLGPSFLKDRAFEYEAEIRASIRFGWSHGLRESVPAREDLIRTFLAGDISQAKLLIDLSRVLENSTAKRTPAAYWAPLPAHFFEAVCIDPRAPSHKRAFIAEHLASQGLQIVETNAFGLSYSGLPAYPDIGSDRFAQRSG